jgi:hypothetical protein
VDFHVNLTGSYGIGGAKITLSQSGADMSDGWNGRLSEQLDTSMLVNAHVEASPRCEQIHSGPALLMQHKVGSPASPTWIVDGHELEPLLKELMSHVHVVPLLHSMRSQLHVVLRPALSGSNSQKNPEGRWSQRSTGVQPSDNWNGVFEQVHCVADRAQLGGTPPREDDVGPLEGEPHEARSIAHARIGRAIPGKSYPHGTKDGVESDTNSTAMAKKLWCRRGLGLAFVAFRRP